MGPETVHGMEIASLRRRALAGVVSGGVVVLPVAGGVGVAVWRSDPWKQDRLPK